jgi:ABC-2 type transport system ATP-binding protein
MMDGNAIEIRGLSKAFGDTLALDDVSFAVRPGEIFGFMGHNGAGKTTTIRMLLGLLRPPRGEACVLGHDIVRSSLAIRRVSGYLPDDYALPKKMSARRFLRYIGAMFGFAGPPRERRIVDRRCRTCSACDRWLGAQGLFDPIEMAATMDRTPQDARLPTHLNLRHHLR